MAIEDVRRPLMNHLIACEGIGCCLISNNTFCKEAAELGKKYVFWLDNAPFETLTKDQVHDQFIGFVIKGRIKKWVHG